MIYSTRPANQKVINHRKEIRTVYRSEEGQKVLFNLLHDMGAFRVIHQPEEFAMRNMAIQIMTELGMLDENRVRLFIKQFMESDIETLEKEDLSKAGQESIDEIPENDDFGIFGGDIPPIA